MSSSKQRILRLSLFALIYFVEGAMLTYFSAFNTLYLRSFDLSYSLIGIVGGVTLIPFVLKIFIGYLSDRVPLFKVGHRKPYILIGLVLQTAAFLVLPFVLPTEQFGLYLTLVILAALGVACAVCVLAAWVAILFTKRYPRGLFAFVVGTGRWGLRVCAYAFLLVTDVYPPFSLK